MSRDGSVEPGGEISVLIVDDHRIFREGIQVNLELHDDIKVLGHGANGQQALGLVRELRPDVVIMDINLPLMNGIQVTRTLTAEGHPTAIIMMTAYDDAEQVIHAMRAGASAYCAKEIEPDQLVEVIRHVHRGHYVVHEQVFDRAGIAEWIEKGIQAVAGQYYLDLGEPFSPLSPREMEILQHVTRGLSNKEIAQALQISHQTVKNHMTSILRKLAVEDRTQAAVFALRRGWVRLRDTGKQPGMNTDEVDEV
jgi:DNA-binding NarL/FixJ family response regulator